MRHVRNGMDNFADAARSRHCARQSRDFDMADMANDDDRQTLRRERVRLAMQTRHKRACGIDNRQALSLDFFANRRGGTMRRKKNASPGGNLRKRRDLSQAFRGQRLANVLVVNGWMEAEERTFRQGFLRPAHGLYDAQAEAMRH